MRRPLEHAGLFQSSRSRKLASRPARWSEPVPLPPPRAAEAPLLLTACLSLTACVSGQMFSDPLL